MSQITLRGPFIRLAQAVKVAGLVETGGQAKYLVRAGQVRVNGAPEAKPGRKLVAGDRFQLSGHAEWTVAQ